MPRFIYDGRIIANIVIQLTPKPLFWQGNHAMLYGRIALLAEESPLVFDTCNAFILKPEVECDSPPRSNTLVTAYVSGDGATCSWEQAGPRSFECDCHSDARLDAETGDCQCSLGYFGQGRRFCYQIGSPWWMDMAMITKTPITREVWMHACACVCVCVYACIHVLFS
jgi:hypothetical protein